jgi:DNA processing protein
MTIKVLGCGIDRDYPAAHPQLAARICDRGLVVSEYAPGVEPAPWRFPARKRRALSTMRKATFLQCRPCRTGRYVRCWCGLGVVS